MHSKRLSTMMITALAMMPSSLKDTAFTKAVNLDGFQHQDLTNTASQPIKSSYNSKQRKKSKRKVRG
ncbi:MAG: hypothetical protein ACI9HU_000629 [Colwellia sp.]|jgi:hypothetical protein